MAAKIVAIAASKGGVGKTTLTACLAVQAVKEGNAVALFDWEPQGSLTLWHVARGKPANPDLIRGKRGEDFDPIETAEVQKANGLYNWIFIDTPPSGVIEIERAIEIADFVLIPVQASGFDVGAVGVVANMCKEHDTPFAFVMSQVNPDRRVLNESAISALKKYGPVLSQAVHDRTAYVSAMTHAGKTGPEHPDSRQAKEPRAEIDGVWSAIKRVIAKGAR